MPKQRLLVWAAIAVLCVGAAVAWRGTLVTEPHVPRAEPARLELVVSNSDPYWKSVIAGAEDAAANYNVQLTVHRPAQTADQTNYLNQIDPQKTDGIAVSPAVPVEQVAIINQLSEKLKIVTLDNDAKGSRRHCYVGTDNYSAGRRAAQLLREAIPEGGEVILFVGDTERDNGRLRRQGFFDELTGHSRPPGDVVDPLDKETKVDAIRVVKTYVDDLDRDQATANVRESLREYPNAVAMLGFYAYHGPKCLQVLKEVEKLGQIRVIAFDDDEDTLQGLSEGHVFAAIVQDTYHYGYESVRLLSEMVGGAEYAVPFAGGGSVYLPCSVIRPEDVEAYRQRRTSR